MMVEIVVAVVVSSLALLHWDLLGSHLETYYWYYIEQLPVRCAGDAVVVSNLDTLDDYMAGTMFSIYEVYIH